MKKFIHSNANGGSMERSKWMTSLKRSLSFSALGLTRGMVKVLIAIIFMVGGYHSRYYIRYIWRHISLVDYKLILFFIAAAILVGVGVWYFSNNAIEVEGEEDGSPDFAEENKTAKESTKTEVTAWMKTWAEIKERAVEFGPYALALFLLIHLALLYYYTEWYIKIAREPIFWVTQIIVILILITAPAWKKHQSFWIMARAVIVIALIGAIGVPIYRKIRAEENRPRIVNNSSVYPLPKILPVDTSFIVKIKLGVRTPTIVLPDYYSARFTRLNYTHCYEVMIETGDKYEFCPGKIIEIPEFREVTLIARMPETEVKVRLCDWRIRRVGFPVCPIPISQDPHYPVQEINPVLVSQSSN